MLAISSVYMSVCLPMFLATAFDNALAILRRGSFQGRSGVCRMSVFRYVKTVDVTQHPAAGLVCFQVINQHLDGNR